MMHPTVRTPYAQALSPLAIHATFLVLPCPGGGMADAEDLKSSGDFSSCGFDSHPGHHFFPISSCVGIGWREPGLSLPAFYVLETDTLPWRERLFAILLGLIGEVHFVEDLLAAQHVFVACAPSLVGRHGERNRRILIGGR